MLGIAGGAVAGGAVAFLLERVAYRPLRRRNAPRLAFLISAIGASYFLYNLAGKEFGRDAREHPAPVHQRDGRSPSSGPRSRPTTSSSPSRRW